MKRMLAFGFSALLLSGCTVYMVPDQQRFGGQNHTYQTPPQPTAVPYQQSYDNYQYQAQPTPMPQTSSQPVTQVQVAAANAEVEDTGDNLIMPANVANPGQNYVMVSVVGLVGEIAVPGFWRLRYRAGFDWVDGWWDNDRYYPGYWRPQRHRGADWSWVPGHWAGKYWIGGHWRPNQRAGYVWQDGYWNRNGEWIEGYWMPVNVSYQDKVWEPGYWGPGGIWIEGFWRPVSRSGYIWVAGEYDGYGRWMKGHWLKARPDECWVRGYWDPRGYRVPGRLTKLPKTNMTLVPGHYSSKGGWNEHRWVEKQHVNEGYSPVSQQPRINEPQQVDNYRAAREGNSAAPTDEAQQLDAYRAAREVEDTQSVTVKEGGQLQQLRGSREQKKWQAEKTNEQPVKYQDQAEPEPNHDRGNKYGLKKSGKKQSEERESDQVMSVPEHRSFKPADEQKNNNQQPVKGLRKSNGNAYGTDKEASPAPGHIRQADKENAAEQAVAEQPETKQRQGNNNSQKVEGKSDAAPATPTDDRFKKIKKLSK